MNKSVYLFIYLGFIFLFSCTTARSIVEKPISFDEDRSNLTLHYLSDRYGLEQESPNIVPKMIVLHHTVIPTFKKTFETFDPPTLKGSRPDLNSAGSLNVSSHFLVDRDGSIYQLLPETTMARHVIGLNHCAIGIENVGGTDDLPLTNEQLKANIWLIKYLAKKYNIEYVIGHSEYTLFEGHDLWLEKDDGYRTKKTDPKDAFMQEIRKATRKMKFKPLPNRPL